MRTYRMWAVVATAFAIACGGDGPYEPPPPPEPSVDVTSPTGSMTFSCVGTKCPVVLNAVPKNGSVVGYTWEVDNVRTPVTSSRFEYELDNGVHTVRVRVHFSGNVVKEKAVSVEAKATAPSLSVRVQDTLVTAKAQLTPVVLEASYNGDASKLRWMSAGQQVGVGLRPTISLPVGVNNLTVTDGTLSAPVSVKVTYGGFEFSVKVACPTGECSASGMKAYISANGREEVIDFPPTQSILVRPSFMDEVSSLRLRVEGLTVKSSVVDIPAEKFFSTHVAIVGEKTWNGTPVDLIPAFEESSSPEGVRSFFTRSVVNDRFSYELGSFLMGAEQPVTFAGSWTESEKNQIKQIMRDRIEVPLKVIKFAFVEGAQWNDCNAIEFKKTSTEGSNGGSSSCDPKMPRRYTGGQVTLNVTDISNRLERVVIHEIGHVLGAGHTCSFPTVMWTGCSFALRANVMTAQDIALLQFRITVVNLQWKYGAANGIPEMHQAERLARGWPIEKYTVGKPAVRSLVVD